MTNEVSYTSNDKRTAWRPERMTEAEIKRIGALMVALFNKEGLLPFEGLMVMQMVKDIITEYLHE